MTPAWTNSGPDRHYELRVGRHCPNNDRVGRRTASGLDQPDRRIGPDCRENCSARKGSAGWLERCLADRLVGDHKHSVASLLVRIGIPRDEQVTSRCERDRRTVAVPYRQIWIGQDLFAKHVHSINGPSEPYMRRRRWVEPLSVLAGHFILHDHSAAHAWFRKSIE